MSESIFQTNYSCSTRILNSILEKPTTFMKLVSESGCATETVEKYVQLHLDNNKICEKKGKFRILFSPKISSLEIQFYKLMLNPTTKLVLLSLLKSKPLSQIELVAITDKSNPSVSRSLKYLFDQKIIRRNYNAPFSTYEIINKSLIHSFLKTTIPTIATNFNEFELCSPKPSLFVSLFN